MFLTFSIALRNPISVVTDFSATGDSFLMSLVALSKISCEFFYNTMIWILAGFAYAMPLMFRQVKQTRTAVSFSMFI